MSGDDRDLMSDTRPIEEQQLRDDQPHDDIGDALDVMERAEARRRRPKGLLAYFAGHHVASNLLMLFLLVAGGLSLTTTVIEIFPEFSVDTITVRVPYLGAAPEETEEGVVIKVEEEIASIQGIKRIRSTASEGFGLVTIEIDEGEDNRRVLDDVKSAVDRIETFPAETEQPIVSEVLARRQVISVVVYGDVDQRNLRQLAERVRDDLTALDEITQADLAGVPPYEISIEVSERALRRYGLSFAQVANAVRRSSLDLPGGSVKTEGGEILLRTEGQRYVGREFEQIEVLARPDGSRVLLGEIATVIDGFEDVDVAARFDGKPAAFVQVYRVGDEGALEVTAAVRDYIAKSEQRMPAGIDLATWQDSSEILRQRIGLLLKNAWIGLALVFITLALFLGLKLAVGTTIGLVAAFMGGLWLLPTFDVTINMISLFAFIVSLGIVVDDAIVVGENVYSHLQRGKRPIEAAILGVREMAMPVVFAVLTSVAAFMPMLLVEGTLGKVMRNIPAVVIAVLLMSLVESLLILPAHLSGERKTMGFFGRSTAPLLRGVKALQNLVSSGLERFVHGPYDRLLDLALEWRYVSFATGTAVLLLSVGVLVGGYLKFTFMPTIDADNMTAYLKMPLGTPAEQTQAIANHLEQAAFDVADSYADQLDEPLIVHLSNTVGSQPTSGGGGPTSTGSASGSGSHLAEVNVELLPSEVRGLSSSDIMARWREAVGEVPGATALTYTASIFEAGDAVSVQLAHSNFDTLLRATEDLEGRIAEFPGTKEIADSFEPGKLELELGLTDTGRALGLELDDLARQVRAGFYGEEVQRIQRGRNDVRVMVRYPEEERRSLGDVEQMRIRLADGSEVPFRSVATVEEGRGFANISRVDRRRVVTVTADVDEATANANEINQELRQQVLPSLVASYPGLSFDFEGEQREQADSLGSLRRNFFVALLVIYGLLAIPFRSYTQPLIVMSVIPFGFVGAVAGHLLMGMNMSLLSFFGIVALTGVVVNDSLIMIDLVNRERRAGIPMEVAIRDAGKRRFRPILLTTLTTFMGLSPMIFETSLQARFLIPMALSLGFGIVFATAITLILVPVVYRILEDFHDLFDSTAVAEEKDVALDEGLGEELEAADASEDPREDPGPDGLGQPQPSPA
ncbi:MAG: efflux RND transporter permease subunit [Holophagales bacterium]|nr:efflux RND transporter permease subunit [Holophagales bacterium]